MIRVVVLRALTAAAPAVADDCPPHLDVTIVMVPELVACKPAGYARYDDPTDGECVPLAIGDVRRWADERRYASKTVAVPPSTIRLGAALLEAIVTYRFRTSFEPPQRRSVVVVFRLPERALPKPLRFRRKGGPEIPPGKPVSYVLPPGERHWIHHERADAFAPNQQVEWEFSADVPECAGAEAWTIATRG